MLGENLFKARKKKSMSQEEVAEKLGVSRQTISKWETDESVPDIYQAKKLSTLYGLSLDELIEFDIELKQIEEFIEKTDENISNKVDWNSLWAKKYPVLKTYSEEVETDFYKSELEKLIYSLKNNYSYSDLDAFLVLKDILARLYGKNS